MIIIPQGVQTDIRKNSGPVLNEEPESSALAPGQVVEHKFIIYINFDRLILRVNAKGQRFAVKLMITGVDGPEIAQPGNEYFVERKVEQHRMTSTKYALPGVKKYADRPRTRV